MWCPRLIIKCWRLKLLFQFYFSGICILSTPTFWHQLDSCFLFFKLALVFYGWATKPKLQSRYGLAQLGVAYHGVNTKKWREGTWHGEEGTPSHQKLILHLKGLNENLNLDLTCEDTVTPNWEEKYCSVH